MPISFPLKLIRKSLPPASELPSLIILLFPEVFSENARNEIVKVFVTGSPPVTFIRSLIPSK